MARSGILMTSYHGRAAKVDANQAEIVSALRRVGASVACTHGMGCGFPDLVVGFKGKNILIEVKDGGKPKSARKLTKDQVKWHAEWKGQVCVVKNVDESLAAIGANFNE